MLARPVRAGRGIRVADGSELAVSPRHLEVVAPDHPLRPESDGRRADWWLEQLDDRHSGLRVSYFVPRRRPAVCRLLHLGKARRLVGVMAGETTTPDDVFFAVWHGWGHILPTRFPGAVHLDTRRGHFLLRGSPEGALTSISASSAAAGPVSGI